MPSIVEVRKELLKLVNLYNKHKHDRKFMGNEKQACQSLIVPFIKRILHWETEDPSEFKAEESKSGKRIDYVVYNQGISQFIVEAKAPSKDIFNNFTFYKQALEYGYSKDHNFAILTNFSQIVILACKINVRVVGEAEIARIDLTNISDEDLILLLSFEKDYWVSSGKNNSLFAKLANYKSNIPVDEQLLDDMKRWREILLTNIRKKQDFHDEVLQVEEEVQKFIDRLVFICFCEDKELKEAELKSLLHDKKSRFWNKPGYLLGKINELFADYNRDYNSDLFDISDCDKFRIDDDKLMIILEDLREPKGRIAYDFKSIEADILGKVYENFIGHIQAGKKRFKEKEDIGKRKKGGIYYTPKFIVDYIVNNTVREYIKKKSFEEIKKVKILDPACGSGSFLLRAFDVLIEESSKRLKRALNYEEKRDLMLNCIFGVDVDKRAVAIAKLNLSLKMAERGKSLPMLGDNIRHGNSIIDDRVIVGWDAFVWEDEFKEIMSNGGFDVVVGNPPWGAELLERELRYLRKKYQRVVSRMIDSYIFFIDQAFRIAKDKGFVGFIIPSTLLNQVDVKPVRKLLLERKLSSLISLGEGIFGKEVLNTSTVFISADLGSRCDFNLSNLSLLELKERASAIIREKKVSWMKWKRLVECDPHFTYYVDNLDGAVMLNRLRKKLTSLKDVIDGKIQRGVSPDVAAAHIISKQEAKELNLEEDLLKPSISGTQIKSYHPCTANQLIIYTTRDSIIKKYPNTLNYLERFHHLNSCKEVKQKKHPWWALHRPRNPKIFDSPKFIGLTTTKTIELIYDENSSLYVTDAMYVFKIKAPLDPLAIMGLMQSKVFLYLYRIANQGDSRVIPQIKAAKLDIVPIPSCKSPHEIVKLVTQILSLNKQLNETGNSEDKIKIQKEIEKIDNRIDKLAYTLYGVTEEEKKIIDKSLQ